MLQLRLSFFGHARTRTTCGSESTKDYEEAENFLKSRFEKCKTIPGTHGLYSVVPENNYNLNVKIYFDFKIVSFFKNEKCANKLAIKER